MHIDSIVNRHYPRVSVLEDTRQVAEWLADRPYFAVVDEDLQVCGIITRKDILRGQGHQLIDCSFDKPGVSLHDPLTDVFDVMVDSENDSLPVFDGKAFVGVITMQAITALLISSLLMPHKQ